MVVSGLYDIPVNLVGVLDYEPMETVEGVDMSYVNMNSQEETDPARTCIMRTDKDGKDVIRDFPCECMGLTVSVGQSVEVGDHDKGVADCLSASALSRVTSG